MANNEATLVLKAKDLATIEVRRVTEEMRRASRESIENTKSANRIAQDSARATSRIQIDAARSAQRIAEQAARRTSDAFRKSNREIETSFNGVKNAISSAFGFYAIARFSQEVFKATTEVQGLRASLLTNLGSQTAAANELAFVAEQADRVGFSFRALAPEYAALIAAGTKSNLTLAEQREIFLGIVELGTVYKKSAADIGGALLAVQQVISKGVVSAEELRGQLGERIPGAFSLAAKAINVTEQELNRILKSGSLTAKELLPLLAREFRNVAAAGLEVAQKSPAAELERLKNAYFDALQIIGNSGTVDAAADVFRLLRDVLATVPDQVARVATALQTITDGFKQAGAGIDGIFGESGSFGKAIGFVLDSLALLPANAKAAIGILIVEFVDFGDAIGATFADLALVAESYYIGLQAGANVSIGAVKVAWGALIDYLTVLISDYLGSVGEKLSAIPGLGTLADQFNTVASGVKTLATNEAEAIAGVNATASAYTERLAAIKVEQAAIEASRIEARAASDDQISAIFAERDASVDLLAVNKAKAAALSLLAEEARAAADAQARAAAAAELNARAADKETKAFQALVNIARDLSAQFNGPDRAANERYADTLDKIGTAYRTAVKGAKDATAAALAYKLATGAINDADKQRIESLIQIEAAQMDADAAVRNYTSSAEIELRNLGLSREERRINEAGLRTEAEFRAKITKATKNNTGAYADLSAAQIDAMVKAEDTAARAAEAQNIIAEAGRKAAEEYRRQWEQAFDNIVDAALRGGDSLKNVVKEYLRDIVAQFAKKIILNVITKYSEEGKKGKDGGKPSLFERGTTFVAGVAGVRDAYRNGGGVGGAISGAASGAAAGSVFGPVGTIVGAIVGGLAGLFGGSKAPDLRLGAAGATRKPETNFNTAFGAQQIGVRGGTDTAQFVNLVTEFDKTIAGIVGNFSNGQDQLDAIKNRLRTWSVDLKGDAITTEAVLGSRFNAILSTFSADIQAFVGTMGTVEERAQRLQDAAFIQGASKASILANTFNDLARILTANKIAGESVAQTYERVSASVEILRAALAISGVTVKQTGDEFIKFAADIATAAGGTQQAAQLWETYFNTFYTGEERALKAVEIANKRRAEALAGLGLDANTTAEQFRETFERLLPTLTPEQIVQWLRAGEAIGAAADAQDGYNDILTEGSEKLRGLADSLRTIEQQIDAGFTELERSGFTDFERSLLSINDNLQATTASLLEQRAAAVAAGASAQTLARYDLALGRAQLLAAAQAAAAIEKLRKAARSLIDQLYGKGAKQFSDSGTQAFQDIGDAAQSMYESQLNSIKTIQDYLDGQLLGGTSTLTPVQQFDEAQRQFNAAILAGNAQEATRLADVLLKLGQGRFASSQPYTDLEATVRAALQGLLGSIGQPVGPTGAVGTGGQGSPEEFDASARENRLELALQLSEIVRELLLATGDSLSEVAASIGLNMTALVTDLGVNLTDLSVGTASSLATIAQSLGVELTDLAENVGVDLGDLSDSQSLINGALKASIDKLPADQREALRTLLTDVEEAARTGGPDEINRAIGLLEDKVRDIGGDTASALAPFFTGVNPVDPLNSIDSAVRAIYQPGSLLDQINAGIAELVRVTVLPQPETAPPIAPAGNNAVYVPSAVVPGRSSFTATPANTEGNTQVVEQLKRTVSRLESLEATVRSGTTQQVRATVGVGETIVSASDKRQPVKPKLVMSE